MRAADSLNEQRLILLPPGQVRRLDALLASIEARRPLAQHETDMLDELCHVAVGGLIDGTLTVVSDDSEPQDGPRPIPLMSSRNR